MNTVMYPIKIAARRLNEAEFAREANFKFSDATVRFLIAEYDLGKNMVIAGNRRFFSEEAYRELERVAAIHVEKHTADREKYAPVSA